MHSHIGVSGFSLKLIAVLSMICDHAGYVFHPGEVQYRIVGRLAFPIMCFLLVEGYFHTSDIKKYMIRMLAFSLISEIPYNIMVSRAVLESDYQNVYFTLLAGLLMLYAMDKCKVPALSTMCLGGALLFVTCLRADYSLYGIVIIYIFYLFRYEKNVKYVLFAVVSIIMGGVQCAAVLVIPFLYVYNGKKGPAWSCNNLFKYGFYIFYPIHMLIFGLIV